MLTVKKAVIAMVPLFRRGVLPQTVINTLKQWRAASNSDRHRYMLSVKKAAMSVDGHGDTTGPD
jgi:hypothetical protein